MKFRIVLFMLVVFAFSSCNTKTSKTQTQSVDVAQLLNIIDKNVDKELYITGTVNHVCSHSGRRCFLIDSTGDNSIKIEAAGEIESFSKELIGTELKVKGIIKENRLSAAEIDEWEVEVIEKHPKDAEADGETCSAEMANINQMRAWMKEHGKDYYSIYYVDGLSYEVVE
ncbi:MAG: hypothetical protein PF541_12585 [Prolixibacteraceae bacterium]|jgi:hypothetical protein|nr:hypothetical protein [Prolixibacteraceae bacterium]